MDYFFKISIGALFSLVLSVSLVLPVSAQPSSNYINTSNLKVNRPTLAAVTPIGATARCRDKSYSFSKNKRGTCSHHGGVAKWF